MGPVVKGDLRLDAGRNQGSGAQAECLTAYGEKLVGDYARYTAGTDGLETAERLTAEEREPSLRLFLLVIGALRALTERDPSLVLDAFLLRAMSVSGYAPALDDCARCSATGPHRAFSVAAGGVVCSSCQIGRASGREGG